MKILILSVATVALLSLVCFSQTNSATQRERLDKIQQELKGDVPRITCVDERFATGGQPTDGAFQKLAANGYRAVLNLRTEAEGVDLLHEQASAEKAGLRYISIPVVSAAPKAEQVDEFFKAVKNTENQPMFIHCGSANRVGAFWLIYRVVEQGWAFDKALVEAEQIGLTSASLKAFASDYINAHKPKKSG
jgi:uncharacterized protein (TIGR01244 family)